MALAPGRVYANSLVRVTIHFTDPNGVDIDPGGVIFRSHDPFWNEQQFVYDGSNTPLTTVIKTAAGHYYFDLLVNFPGQWFYRWETSSTATASGTATNISISAPASPAVITWPNSNLALNTAVSFTTEGTMPTPLVEFVNYYVIAAGLTASTFQIALTPGGAAINTTAPGFGQIQGIVSANQTNLSQASATTQTTAMEGQIVVQRSRFTPYNWPTNGWGPGSGWWYW
jgi:hypothetical protein